MYLMRTFSLAQYSLFKIAKRSKVTAFGIFNIELRWWWWWWHNGVVMMSNQPQSTCLYRGWNCFFFDVVVIILNINELRIRYTLWAYVGFHIFFTCYTSWETSDSAFITIISTKWCFSFATKNKAQTERNRIISVSYTIISWKCLFQWIHFAIFNSIFRCAYLVNFSIVLRKIWFIYFQS